MTNEEYMDMLEARIDELEEKESLYKDALAEHRKIRAVIKAQEGLKKYIDTAAKNTDTRLYTTQELADMCNWELGTYARKMTEHLSADYYRKHGREPVENDSGRPVYPRYMLQIMQSHLERKFG